MVSLRQRIAGAPVFASPFRPFYLLGALYAPLAAVCGAAAWAGWVDLNTAAGGTLLWHGHEMLSGFATAIVAGTLLTALPSWAGITELRGLALAGLVLVWVLGRIAFWLAPWWPGWLVALCDVVFYPALAAMLAAPLWRVPTRLYRLALPILAALAAADGVFMPRCWPGNPSWPQARCAGRSGRWSFSIRSRAVC